MAHMRGLDAVLAVSAVVDHQHPAVVRRGRRIGPQQFQPADIDPLRIPLRLRQEELQPLHRRMLRPGHRLGSGQRGQRLVAVPRRQQAGLLGKLHASGRRVCPGECGWDRPVSRAVEVDLAANEPGAVEVDLAAAEPGAAEADPAAGELGGVEVNLAAGESGAEADLAQTRTQLEPLAREAEKRYLQPVKEAVANLPTWDNPPVATVADRKPESD